MSQLCVAVVLSIASGANLGMMMLEGVPSVARAYEAQHPRPIPALDVEYER
jgi:hypothetical protein